jgi:hypothetical protein
MENQAFDRWVVSIYDGEAVAPPAGLEAAVFARLDAEGASGRQGHRALRRWGMAGLVCFAVAWGGWWWAGSQEEKATEGPGRAVGASAEAEAPAAAEVRNEISGVEAVAPHPTAGAVEREGSGDRGQRANPRPIERGLPDAETGPVAPCEPVVPLEVVPFARAEGGKGLVYPSNDNQVIPLPATITIRQ